jgi:hypothetical protein
LANVIQCGNCGEILKTFNDDCQTCLGKENNVKAGVETELLFPVEKKIRETKERNIKRRNAKHGKNH